MDFESICHTLEIEYRVPGSHHHTREGWIQIECPFCGPRSGKFHMGYPINGRTMSCWRCGSHDLLSSLHEASKAPIHTILELLKGLPKQSFQKKITKGNYRPPKGIVPLGKPHLIYLNKRKYNSSKLQIMWSIMGTNERSSLPWRLFIPILLRNKPVSWTTRSLGDTGARYISSPPEDEEIPHKSLLYGEDYCRHSIVVCEGPTDVWRIGPGAVATFGTSVTKAQILRMSKYVHRTICFDNEPTAQKQARKLCETLALYPGQTNNAILNAKDPGVSSAKEIKQLRETCLPE